jgi:broad specificity phosphatase PhoE
VDDPPGRRPLSGSPIPDGLDATLVLVRHGESRLIVEGRFQGQADSPLTDAGREQARLVAARLARSGGSPALPIPDGPPQGIAYSPLARAAETADAIASALSTAGWEVPRRAETGLLEIGQGQWEGLHRDEIKDRFGAELDGWRARPAEVWAPGGESLADVAARVRPALADVLRGLGAGGPSVRADPVPGYIGATPGGPWSILVAHDGVFKVVLLTLFDLPLERFWMWSFDLCGLTIVEFRAGRAVLRAHNLTEHLAPRQDAAALAERRAREATGAL